MSSDGAGDGLPDDALWQDLARSPQEIPSPAWHEEVLAERQREVDEGRAKCIPLEEFRRSLQREIGDMSDA